MKPYYDHAGITIYHGDCREILPACYARVLVTDPPYGIGYSNPGPLRRRGGETITGDDEEFMPDHLLAWLSGYGDPLVARPGVIWGGNHFASRLPDAAGWIVWDKRLPGDSKNQGDAELAWTNCLGSTRIFRALWNGGGTLRAENGNSAPWHPAQKPERLYRFCIERVTENSADSICDPYMGSGGCLIAAKSLGRQAIGIEIEEKYCEIAAKRLSQEVLDFGRSA